MDTWVGDGFCDAACNVTRCAWDAGDCALATVKTRGRSHTAFNSGVHGAPAAAAAWTPPNYCAVGCPNNWIGDKVCDKRCEAPECGWDGADCGMARLTGDASIPGLEAPVNGSVRAPGHARALWLNVSRAAGGGRVVTAEASELHALRVAVLSEHHSVLTLLLDPSVFEVPLSPAACRAAAAARAAAGSSRAANESAARGAANESAARGAANASAANASAAAANGGGGGSQGSSSDGSAGGARGAPGREAGGAAGAANATHAPECDAPEAVVGSLTVWLTAEDNGTRSESWFRVEFVLLRPGANGSAEAPPGGNVSAPPSAAAAAAAAGKSGGGDGGGARGALGGGNATTGGAEAVSAGGAHMAPSAGVEARGRQLRLVVERARAAEQSVVSAAWRDLVAAAVDAAREGSADELLAALLAAAAASEGGGGGGGSGGGGGAHGRSLDTYGDSLVSSQRLISSVFGRSSRKVPAHMPHYIDVRAIASLQVLPPTPRMRHVHVCPRARMHIAVRACPQGRFPAAFEATSSRRFRDGSDVQYAFAYYHCERAWVRGVRAWTGRGRRGDGRRRAGRVGRGRVLAAGAGHGW